MKEKLDSALLNKLVLGSRAPQNIDEAIERRMTKEFLRQEFASAILKTSGQTQEDIASLFERIFGEPIRRRRVDG